MSGRLLDFFSVARPRGEACFCLARISLRKAIRGDPSFSDSASPDRLGTTPAPACSPNSAPETSAFLLYTRSLKHRFATAVLKDPHSDGVPREADLGRCNQVNYPKGVEQLLAMRPAKLPEAIPASSEVVQQLRTSCPIVVEKLPPGVRFDPTSTMWATFCRILADVDQIWSVWAKSWAELDQLAKFGQTRPSFGQI